MFRMQSIKCSSCFSLQNREFCKIPIVTTIINSGSRIIIIEEKKHRASLFSFVKDRDDNLGTLWELIIVTKISDAFYLYIFSWTQVMQRPLEPPEFSFYIVHFVNIKICSGIMGSQFVYRHRFRVYGETLY